MFRLFEIRPNTNVSMRIGNDWTAIQSGLLQNLETTQHYYNTHTFAIDSGHYLNSILINLGVPTKLNLERFYANVVERANDLSKVLGMCGSANRGKVMDNVFFPSNCTEAILYSAEDFDYEDAYQNWRSLRPFKVLRHPYTNTGLNLCTNRQKVEESGIAIVEINIALLAVQYKGFRDHEEKLKKTVEDYAERSMMQFFHMFPIPNMLPSYLDELLFNRLYARTVGLPVLSFRNPHPFHLINWDKRLNTWMDLKLRQLTNTKYDYLAMLRNVPLVTELNLDDLFKLPDVAYTRQVMWLLVTARIRQLTWLLIMSQRNGNTQNMSEYNRLRHYFKRIKYNNQIITQIPIVFKEILEIELEEIYDLLQI